MVKSTVSVSSYRHKTRPDTFPSPSRRGAGEGELAKSIGYGSNGGCFVYFEINGRDPGILRNPNRPDPAFFRRP